MPNSFRYPHTVFHFPACSLARSQCRHYAAHRSHNPRHHPTSTPPHPTTPAASEKIVSVALDRLMTQGTGGRGKPTTVVVAHRLSTIRAADVIVVLAGGRIVERGTHAELLRIPGGVYAGLVAAQEGNNAH